MKKTKFNFTKSPMKQRIFEYLAAKGVSYYDLVPILGYSTTVTLKSNSALSEKTLTKFFDYAKDVSKLWIVAGEGSMFAKKQLNISTNKLPVTIENIDVKSLKKDIADLKRDIAALKTIVKPTKK